MSDENNNSGEGDNANKGDNKGQDGKGDNGNDSGNQKQDGNGDSNANTGLSQEQYEKRITELDKRDKALDSKLERMEKLNEKITAEGSPTGGQAQQPTAGEKQKANLVKNFGGCIDGLDKML